MNRLFFIVLLIWAAADAFGQQAAPKGWITYIQRHRNAVVGGDDYYLGEMRFIGQEVTYTYKTLPATVEAKDTVDAQGNNFVFYGKSTAGGRPTGNMVYIDYSNLKVECVHYIEREYFIYEDTLPNIKWVIGEEKKNIGGFVTQKATGEHRGRIYEAWFAPEIPVSYGPWKLGGLPGLVLHAESQDGELSFTVDMIQIPAQDKIEIKPPQRGIRLPDFRTFWTEANRYEQQAMERRRLRYERSMRETLPEGTPITIGQITNSRFSIEKLVD